MHKRYDIKNDENGYVVVFYHDLRVGVFIVHPELLSVLLSIDF